MANAPRFEVYPRKKEVAKEMGVNPEGLIGSVGYGWRFRDANGRITFIGGEGFTRREDANRALLGAIQDVLGVLGLGSFKLDTASLRASIVHVDE